MVTTLMVFISSPALQPLSYHAYLLSFSSSSHISRRDTVSHLFSGVINPYQQNPSPFAFAAFDSRDLAEHLTSASGVCALHMECMLHYDPIKQGAIDERRDSCNTIAIIFT